MSDTGPTELEGSLEQVTFENPVTGYAVGRFRAEGLPRPITITGFFAGTRPGEVLRITGGWETHPRFGEQFRVSALRVAPPTSPAAIRRLLAEGSLPGVGPQLAGRLVAAFGADTLAVIAEQPERLEEVAGIGAAKAAAIHAAWREQAAWRRLQNLLAEMGVAPALAASLFGRFGDEAARIVREDPYRLVAELPEVGFETADRMARHGGRPVDPGERAAAAIRHLLNRRAAEGHTCSPELALLETCEGRWGIDARQAADSLAALAETGEVSIENTHDGRLVSPGHLMRAEAGVARRLTAKLRLPHDPPQVEAAHLAQLVHRSLAIALSENQLGTLQQLLAHRVAVVSGGPGTGKTTLIRSICTVFEHLRRAVVLAAPTGRAARRLAQVAGRQAHTLHRLLEYQPAQQRFLRDADNPLSAEVMVVDEASMVDIELMHALLCALPLTATLVLVGDAGQLPSVGPGNVLADLIRSERVPVYYLTEMFRQAEGGQIALAAHSVRAGRLPAAAEGDGGATAEFVLVAEDQPRRVLEAVVAWCREVIPARFGLDPIADVQVLTPMHKGEVGTVRLNQVLQGALNPQAAGFGAGGAQFRLGDKVMHLVNNYQKEVFNGDIGTICEIDPARRRLAVAYEGRRVAYEAAELHELAVAYAISVHKSQGSEYPAVIVPLVTQHYALLQRNVLYTALTRARRLAVIIGSRKALGIAVGRDQPSRRLTWLAERLREQ